MSQRTFCDRCGKECGHRRSVVHLAEFQYAEADPHSPVAEDNYHPPDLCDICTDVIKEVLSPALRMAERYDRLAMAEDSARMGSPEDSHMVRLPVPFPPDVPHG